MTTTPQVAIITGAASGIGLATATLLAEKEYLVITGDLHAVPHELPKGWKVHLIADVRNLHDLQQLVDTALQYGEIACLVNNAGMNMVRTVTEVTEADWDNCLDTNLKSAFFASQLVVPSMRRRGGGAIINVASNAGILPRAHDPVYSISKLALVGLTRSLALCLSPDRIRVNAVCPGPVSQTGIINADLASTDDPQALIDKIVSASPLANAHGRMITPDEVAESIAYLASAQACMVTGTSITIDGGKSLGVPPH